MVTAVERNNQTRRIITLLRRFFARIACKVLVSIGLYSLRFGFLKKASFLENRVCKKGQVKVTLFPGMVFQERILF